MFFFIKKNISVKIYFEKNFVLEKFSSPKNRTKLWKKNFFSYQKKNIDIKKILSKNLKEKYN